MGEIRGFSRLRYFHFKLWDCCTLTGTGTLTDTGKTRQSLITKINIRGQRLKTLAFLSLPAPRLRQAGPEPSSDLRPQGYLCPQGYKDIRALLSSGDGTIASSAVLYPISLYKIPL